MWRLIKLLLGMKIDMQVLMSSHLFYHSKSNNSLNRLNQRLNNTRGPMRMRMTTLMFTLVDECPSGKNRNRLLLMKLVYNLSPSFNWMAQGFDGASLKSFIWDLAKHGYDASLHISPDRY